MLIYKLFILTLDIFLCIKTNRYKIIVLYKFENNMPENTYDQFLNNTYCHSNSCACNKLYKSLSNCKNLIDIS